ncbi:hypothetical protein [Lyngbya aestuarii]|uniref:hypothetical protein n=1 Tax=Lyngbya aestuarii TaxID=118322 RepID=UPI00403D93BD
MEEQLKQLVCQVQQHPDNIQKRQQALSELVEQILRSRPICRPRRDKSLSGIYLDILQAAKRQLHCNINQNIDRYKPQVNTVRNWVKEQQDGAFKKVLSEAHLQQLALAAQQYKPKTPEWQYALRELLYAIRLSGRLSRLYSRQVTADVYADAVNQTLLFVCQNVNKYEPSKGRFMAWVNYRLDMSLRETKQELKDPFVKAVNGKIIRIKYQLALLVKKVKLGDLQAWINLVLRGLISDANVAMEVISILTVLFVLSQLVVTNPTVGDSLLFELAKETLPVSLGLYDIKLDSTTLEEIPQLEVKPLLSEKIRQYIQEDPDRLFQKHIREHPQATFQAIALARFDGQTWKEMSASFNIGIPALNSFFQRRLRELAPAIKKHLQE